MRKIIGFVLLAGIAFGLFVVVTIPFEMVKKAEAEGWPSRKGVITHSYVSQQRGSTGAPYSKVEICGNYKDTGERFCVRRVRYGGFRWGGGKASALQTVARYPVGSQVDVYYSPDDSRETLLEARSPWTEMFVLLGLGLGFLLLPMLLWVFRARIEPGRYGGA
jgi:Protein of unknown function (DUF3592)